MTLSGFKQKVSRKLWSILVSYTHGTPFYNLIYRSYWHYIILGKKMQYINLHITCIMLHGQTKEQV